MALPIATGRHIRLVFISRRCAESAVNLYGESNSLYLLVKTKQVMNQKVKRKKKKLDNVREKERECGGVRLQIVCVSLCVW